ncbi:MAG: hypothetical protein Rpha_1893 [Candidatus Ruthia sp. Apha_13_S6]|nr:hypothetical protein [Candidatus Ruthia sp. Apha_13_S6]
MLYPTLGAAVADFAPVETTGNATWVFIDFGVILAMLWQY